MNSSVSDTQSIAAAYQSAQGQTRRAGILIVDDHDLVRLGLRALIGSQAAQATQPPQVFEVKTLAAAMEVYGANRSSIDLVFMDLGLPDCTGLQGLATFKSAYPEVTVVVLSGEGEHATVQGATALGAAAYLRKTADLSDVIEYIRSRGLFAGTADTPVEEAGTSVTNLPLGGLTQRQVQVLTLLLEGKSNREIGDITCLAEGTVKNHVSTILLHFGARSRSQLISSLR